MNTCPNPNSPEWKKLVAALGEGVALTAYAENGNVIPTVEQADQLLRTMKYLEKDEQLARSSDAFKLERAKQQNTSLNTVMLSAKPNQVKTIQKLIDMNLKYQQFLRNNIRLRAEGKPTINSVSVSSFIGSSEFKGDATEYEAFKLFGTFMHEALELGQIEALRTGKGIDEVMTREFFDERLEEYQKKNPFYIENLDNDEMYAMALRVAQHVSLNKDRGYIILPEITVSGVAKSGSVIVGRLDLMLIDKNGRIKIFDFKTKKVNNLMEKDTATGQFFANEDIAVDDLENQRYPIDKNQRGTAAAFIGGQRSAYDTWTLQLKVYENLLNQNEIDVNSKDKTILAMLYQTDKDKKFLGRAIHIFTEEDYYGHTGADIPGEDGMIMTEDTRASKEIKRLRDIVDEEIPTPKTRVKKQQEQQKELELLDFQPGEEQDETLQSALKTAVNNELDNVLKRLKDDDVQNDENLQKTLAARRETLRRFQRILTDVKSNDLAIRYSTNFSAALDAVFTDIKELQDNVRNAMKTIKFESSTSVSKEGKQVMEAYRRSQALAATWRVLRDIVLENNAEETARLGNESPTMQRLNEIENGLAEISSNYGRVTLFEAVQVMKTPGEKVFTGVNKDLREVYEAQLKRLEQELEDLKNNKAPGVFAQIRSTALSFVSKEYKKRLAERLGDDAAFLPYIQEKQQQIDKIKAILDGALEYSDEALERYISSVTDPNSDMYIGAQDIFNSNSITSGMMLDRGIASASNSDLGLSAFTQMLKNADGAVRLAIQNNYAIMDFDRKRDSLMKRFTVEQLNDMISEVREKKFADRETGDVITKNVFSIVKPTSAEYDGKFQDYNINRKRLEKEVQDLKVKRNEVFGTPEHEAAERAYLDKVKEKEQLNRDHIKWMLENSQLPYDEKFYQLQLQLPEEIREQLQMKYLEMETITYQVGKGNEVLLEEEDFERLKEIEDEIRVLRDQAKKLNPEYAQMLDEFNDLFEYDVNEAYYKRMRNNAEDRYKVEFPDIWEKWKRENEVTRWTGRPALPEIIPTYEKVVYEDQYYFFIEQRPGGAVELMSETGEKVVVMRKDIQSMNWYEKRADLFNQRAQLYGENPSITALIEERNSILRPHRDGYLRPQYLTEDEISRLDAIEAEIEDIIENTPKAKLEEGDWAEAKRIKVELNNLVRKELNPEYLRAFNDKTEKLFTAQRLMFEAEAALSQAEAAGDKKAIKEAAEKLAFHETHFGTYEKQYESWYNKHHMGKYRSILTGFNPETERMPKNYNFESVPADTIREDYAETHPHPKYKVKRLKESSYNPDFMKSPDGIPMPKAITMNADGHYVIRPGFETSANVNKKFKDMTRDAEVFSFYNDLTKMFFDLQKKVEGKKIGYMVPGFAASTIENIARKGVMGSVDAEYQKFIDRNVKRYGAQERVDNTWGDLGGATRHRFTEQLPEEMQTRDAIGAVVKYTIEAQYNIAMQELAPRADMMIDHLEMLKTKLQEDIQAGRKAERVDPVTGKKVQVDMGKRVSELENIISIMRFERRKFIEGATEDPSKTYNRVLAKRLNTFFAYSSFVRIGFDVANQAKNYFSGNLQAFIGAGGLASDQYSREDYMWAKKKIYGPGGFLANYFRDWGRVSDVSETTMLYRFFNPAQKDFLKYYSEVTGSKQRRVAGRLTNVQELGFMLQDKGDTEIALTVMYSVMNHRRFRVFKLDSQGNKIYEKDNDGNDVTVPVHEIYYKNSKGELTRRADVEYTDQDENMIRNIIYSEMRRAQGNYSKSDMTAFEQTIMGKIIFFFKKYLVPQLLNRFGYLRPNWEAGEVAVGYWRALAQAWKYYGPDQVAKHMLLGTKFMSKSNRNQMGDFYTRKVAQARRDMIAMAIMWTVAQMLLSYVRGKDDDDEELGVLEGNAIRILWGVKGETLSMFPLGGGSDEYIRNFTEVTSLIRELKKVKNAGSHGLNYTLAMIINGGEEPVDTDSYMYQDIWKDAFYSKETGPYEKGDAKITKDLMDFSGLRNFRDLIDPNDRIDILKRNM